MHEIPQSESQSLPAESSCSVVQGSCLTTNTSDKGPLQPQLLESRQHSIPFIAPQSFIVPMGTGTPLEWSTFLNHAPDNCVGRSDLFQENITPLTSDSADVHPELLSTPVESNSLPVHLSLFPGSDLSIDDALVAILTFVQSSHLSGRYLCNLLDLLCVLLPQPNNLPKTVHFFRRYFGDSNVELQLFHYCNICWKRRTSSTDTCSCKGSKVRYFIMCPLVPQIQKLYSRPGFVEKLNYKFTRSKVSQDNIEDIYDSAIYKAAGDILDNNQNISLTWYTDGVSVYECSSYSLWPFVFVLNELPPHERFNPENLILGGLWGDCEKPHPNLFLLPLYNQISILKNGFTVTYHGSEQEHLVQAILLCGCCDMPAKATFLNMKGHAGYKSCPKCFINGEKSARTGSVMVFPHAEDFVLRNDANYQECVLNSVRTKSECEGVLGPSVLSFMIHSNFIDSVSIDSMHSLFQGLTKQLLKLFFDSKFKDEAFYLGDHTAKVNERLRNLNLPHFVERLVEDVLKLHFWKASLCRTFLLYLALVIFKGIMKDEYYDNLTHLVNGISLLNQESISLEDVTAADNHLKIFCRGFQTLYGLRHMSANLHMLRHLAKSVIDTGPLWVSSCYKFEDLNGKLSSLAHGTTHAIMQIASNFSFVTNLPLLISNLKSECVKTYCTSVAKRGRNLRFIENIGEKMYVVGKFDDSLKESVLIKSILYSRYQTIISFQTFSRLYKNSVLHVSASYCKGSRESSFCTYKLFDCVLHGQILTFVKTIESQCYFALISRSYDLNSNIDRCVTCHFDQTFDLIPICDIIGISFCLKVDGKVYLVEPLNPFEME